MRNSTRYWQLAALIAPLVSSAAMAQPAPAAPVAPAVELDGQEPDPARPPPKNKGVVWGVVTSAGTKEPILEAQISVVGRPIKTTADLDGRYRLELAAGTYEIRIWYEGHKARRLQNVTVVAGKVARIDAVLDSDKAAVEVVEVEVTPDRASAAAQLVMRRNAASSGDAISAQDITKTPDRNAADAARRIVGATLIGNKYVYVRGLGDRYTNALLNGTPLPSPEPDQKAVPLDLFPSLILSDITIAKTFTPDVPGDFAGGSVRVNTRELPESFLFGANLSVGFNTQSTFAQRLSYQGSSLDWLGIDGGARAFPKDIPDYKVVRLGPKPDGSLITRDELTGYGRSLNSFMTTKQSLNLPNGFGNMVIGNTFKLRGGQELGVMAALSYSRKFSRRVGEIIRTYTVDETKPDTLRALNDYKAETGLDQVSWGAYSTVAYAPSKNHKVTLTGLHSRSSDKEAREIEGFNEESSATLRDTRLRFISRSLTFVQLAGAHKLAAAGDAKLDWNLSISSATSDEPDTRENVYVKDAASGVYSWDSGTLSGSHFYAKQVETAYGGGVDWTQPLVKGDQFVKLKAGTLINKKSRTFEARRFHFIQGRGALPEVFDQPADKLFAQKNIGTAFELEEYTRPNDSYTADQSLYAGYLMFDAWLSARVRVVAGARVEASTQSIDSFDPFAAELAHVKSSLQTADFLPSATLIIKTTKDSNLRASATRTVARPQLRELSPFVFTDYFGAREILGNPNLDRTSIYNGDLRFEVFPEAGEVLAMSVFYKQFYAPIEQVILPSNAGIISYQNAKGARVMGVELEVRKGFGFMSPALRDFGLLGNVTLVSSRVQLDETKVGIQTNNQRPLAGQSPFVINSGLDFSRESSGTRARILYNVFGPRIAQVGSTPLPDVYEEPRHQLDLAVAQRVGKHVDLKFTAENILDSAVRFTQTAGTTASVVNQYRTGSTLILGAQFTN